MELRETVWNGEGLHGTASDSSHNCTHEISMHENVRGRQALLRTRGVIASRLRMKVRQTCTQHSTQHMGPVGEANDKSQHNQAVIWPGLLGR